MPKVQIWGFQCSRCGHKWLPREGIEHPQVCPKCKSPYWDRPRRDEVAPEHQVKSHYHAKQLDTKTVTFKLSRNGGTFKGVGWFTAMPLANGYMQVSIKQPFKDGEKDVVRLTQAEVDCIKTC